MTVSCSWKWWGEARVSFHWRWIDCPSAFIITVLLKPLVLTLLSEEQTGKGQKEPGWQEPACGLCLFSSKLSFFRNTGGCLHGFLCRYLGHSDVCNPVTEEVISFSFHLGVCLSETKGLAGLKLGCRSQTVGPLLAARISLCHLRGSMSVYFPSFWWKWHR